MSNPVEPSRTAMNPEPPGATDGDETATAALPTGAPPIGPLFAPATARGEVGTLGPYRVLKELGKGGMGAVYLALDTRLDRKIALKVMLPVYAADRDAKERFLREARAAAKISHDNVVTVFEADERDGVPYIAMQLLQGYPLNQYLKTKGAPALPHVIRIGRETALGLAAAHAMGLVHRDIKPANLWLEAPNGRVKVLDFGLAKPVAGETELTESGAVVGTPAYMSPEQARAQKLDHRTDLFSLGAVLYRLCSGKVPFSGPTAMSILMALGNDDPTPLRELNPNVPESLAQLVHQLLAKRSDDRPQTANEVAKRLRAILDQLLAPPAAVARETGATGTDDSRSSPVVVYALPLQPPIVVPMQIEAQPHSAFAGLGLEDGDATQAERAQEQKPVRKASGGKGMLVAAGVAVLLAAGASAIVISQMGKQKEPVSSPPESVSPGEKSGTKGGSAPVKPATDPDRALAEYVLSVGGRVAANEDALVAKPTELPKEPFRLVGITLEPGNQVSAAGLARVKDCKNLKWLRVQGVAITDADVAPFSGSKSLEDIQLLSGTVGDVGLASFKDCKNLTRITLMSGPVSDVGLANFKGCKELRNLAVGGGLITDTGLGYFRDCKKLEALILGCTQVTDVGLAHFKDCESLRDLKLSGMQVSDVGLASFRDRKWALLDMSGLRVGDSGFAQFKNLEKLGYLDLSSTQVTDAGLDRLKDCKGLVHLNLAGTTVTAAKIEELRKALPLCKIGWDGGVIQPSQP